jgi:toxin ParE1/3/4
MRSDSRPYRLTVKAHADLEVIWRYTFEKWSLAQADDYYRQIFDCFSKLADGTKRGRKIEGVWSRYQALPCQSHFIIYTESDRAVVIIRILHKRMNIGRHL